MSFGNRITALRKAKHLNQKELGVLIGKTGDIVSKYERGHMEPLIGIAAKFAEVLEVSLDYLVRGIEVDKTSGTPVGQAIVEKVQQLSLENQLHAIAVIEGLLARQGGK